VKIWKRVHYSNSRPYMNRNPKPYPAHLVFPPTPTHLPPPPSSPCRTPIHPSSILRGADPCAGLARRRRRASERNNRPRQRFVPGGNGGGGMAGAVVRPWPLRPPLSSRSRALYNRTAAEPPSSPLTRPDISLIPVPSNLHVHLHPLQWHRWSRIRCTVSGRCRWTDQQG
jgi:hypothetical protein